MTPPLHLLPDTTRMVNVWLHNECSDIVCSCGKSCRIAKQPYFIRSTAASLCNRLHGILENSTTFLFARGQDPSYSTVTDLARLRGWSTSAPRRTATA